MKQGLCMVDEPWAVIGTIGPTWKVRLPAEVASNGPAPTLTEPCGSCKWQGRLVHTHSRHCYVGLDLHTGALLCPIKLNKTCPTCHGRGAVLRKAALGYDAATGDVVVEVVGGARYVLGAPRP